MATVKSARQNIITIQYRQEKTDEDYGTCLWADFLLNLDTYDMSISSDCGNFGYGWKPTPETESFLHLVGRFDREYLLRKISSESVFRLDESKKQTIESIRDSRDFYNLSTEQLDDACEEIMDIDEGSEEWFYRQADEIMRSHELMDSFEVIKCVKEFPIGAKTIVEVFGKHVRPFIRKMEAVKAREEKRDEHR